MTTYLNTFTGDTIAPANATLNTITFPSGTSQIQLVWNLNGYDTLVSSNYFAATYLAVNTSAVASPTLLLPTTLQVSPGEEITIVNTGTNPLVVKAFASAAGNPIVTLPASQSVKVIVQTNTTAAGTWLVAEVSAAGGLASLANSAGRGLTTRALTDGSIVFDTVLPNVQFSGGTQTVYPDSASQVLTFTSAATVTLANQMSATNSTEPAAGTYYVMKNLSTGRLTVNAQNMDNVVNGYTYVAPGAFGIFAYAGLGAWVSMVGNVSQGASINSAGSIAYNATRVDCQGGTGAAGTVYTLQNRDFGTVIDFYNVQNGQSVILPDKVAIYFVHNDGLGLNENITFKGTTTPGYNTVTITAQAYAAIATDGEGNVFPGISQLPGGQYLSANPGSVSLPGIGFDNDLTTGFYSSAAGNIALSVAGQDAETWVGNAGSLTHTLGTTTRPVTSTINGNQTITGSLTVYNGIDGGVI